ncbi:hypothetical protein [Formosa sp. L2A11]|uniref:hypothetical protein n=1 Tax=Formosa sp. L2A11 TaxID=2686363 RepID=UPI00131C6F27|nr:hypothetical protein [Formosa sp. L2A11]
MAYKTLTIIPVLRLGNFKKITEIREVKTATLLLALFLVFKPLIPLVEYAAFYDYIKNELCVNKDVPEMHCNGKCHLKAQLAKASDSEKGNNDKGSSFSFENTLVFFQDANINFLLFFPKEQPLKIDTSYNKIYKFRYMGFVFHPPLV